MKSNPSSFVHAENEAVTPASSANRRSVWLAHSSAIVHRKYKLTGTSAYWLAASGTQPGTASSNAPAQTPMVRPRCKARPATSTTMVASINNSAAAMGMEESIEPVYLQAWAMMDEVSKG